MSYSGLPSLGDDGSGADSRLDTSDNYDSHRGGTEEDEPIGSEVDVVQTNEDVVVEQASGRFARKVIDAGLVLAHKGVSRAFGRHQEKTGRATAQLRDPRGAQGGRDGSHSSLVSGASDGMSGDTTTDVELTVIRDSEHSRGMSGEDSKTNTMDGRGKPNRGRDQQGDLVTTHDGGVASLSSDYVDDDMNCMPTSCLQCLTLLSMLAIALLVLIITIRTTGVDQDVHRFVSTLPLPFPSNSTQTPIPHEIAPPLQPSNNASFTNPTTSQQQGSSSSNSPSSQPTYSASSPRPESPQIDPSLSPTVAPPVSSPIPPSSSPLSLPNTLFVFPHTHFSKVLSPHFTCQLVQWFVHSISLISLDLVPLN